MLLWLSLQPPPFAPPRTLRSPRSLSSTRIIEPFTSVPFSSSSNLLMIWSSKRSILVFTTPLKKNLCELTIGNNKDSHLSAQIIVKFGIISCNCSCMCTTKIKWMIRVSKIYFSYGDSIFLPVFCTLKMRDYWVFKHATLTVQSNCIVCNGSCTVNYSYTDSWTNIYL